MWRDNCQRFVAEQPMRFCILLTLFVMISGIAVSAISTSAVAKLSIQSLALLVAFPLLGALGWWRHAGLNHPCEWRNLHLLWLPALLALAPLVSGFQVPDTSTLLIGGSAVILTAVGEEALCRGLMLQALLPQGPLRAATVSAVCFGLLHLLKFFVGAPLSYTLVTVGLNIIFGFGYAALRLRINTLWPLIGLHALGNFVLQVLKPNDSAVAFFLTIGLYLAFLVYGFLLLQRTA
jgi:membrane protease YdiL (CAAX protease family)